MRRALLLSLVMAAGCGHPGPPPSASPEAGLQDDLTPLGLRLFHEVVVTLPEHGAQTLLGNITFEEGGRYTLRAETPLGLRLFEVGHDGQALFAHVAEPLQGKFPALGLAQSVWSIYFGGCSGKTSCTLPSGEQVQETFGATGRLVRRQIRGQGPIASQIDYEAWAPTGPVLHPGRITLSSGQIQVQILLSGFEGL